MFYVYVLHSLRRPRSLHRLQYEPKEAHRGARARGVVATKYRGPWKLIYYEAYIDRHDAEGRERYLKSGSGRRFLRQQLRHYFEKFPARQVLRGPRVQPRERRRRFYVATPLGFEPRITPPKGVDVT
jgi:hypothetical protein